MTERGAEGNDTGRGGRRVMERRETWGGGEADGEGSRAEGSETGGQEEIWKKSGVKVSDSADLLQAPQVLRRVQSWVRCSPASTPATH